MKHNLALPLAVALLLTSAACKRKRTASPETETPSQATASAPAEAASPAPNSPALASTPTSSLPQAKAGASESNPLNGELTDAVARFRDKHKRLPASWQELVQAGFLKALPQPPPGVRYAIDPISAMVVEIK
jgi:hypothetical protein